MNFYMEPKIRVSVGADTFIKKVYIAVASVIWLVASVQAFTDSEDVYALNQLYTSLSSPFLNGWIPSGGDPCAENWEGVACAGPNVTILNLPSLSLTGDLGSALENLTTLIVLNLSNNLLSGGLPVQLPPHIQRLDLSTNQFTGNLPLAFSDLSNLAILNVSSNFLSGTLLDMLDQLEALTTLDLSKNGFDGSLPSSFADLTTLNDLYLQDNRFTGTIDVLAKLPLIDLDISNNSFTGWIPSELQKFPPSKLAGNSFNTFPAPPPPLFFPPPPSDGSSSQSIIEKSPKSSPSRGLRGYLTVGRLVGIAVAALLLVVIAVLVILFCVSRSHHREREEKNGAESSWHGSLVPSLKGDQKQPFVLVGDKKEEPEPLTKVPPKANKSLEFTALKPEPLTKVPPKANKSLEFTALKPPPVPIENLKLGKNKGSTPRALTVGVKNSIAAQAYTIADLQLATQSFAEENLIGDGMLGKVYKAEMPNGRLVAVKMLDYSITRMGREDFLEFLSKISGLRHVNITELVGYCVEHGEHLLVYEFVGNGTLYENLHLESAKTQRLFWKPRAKIALGVAKALEYLHEQSIFHRNLTSTNILLDDDLIPHLSDCGLANHFLHDQASAERLGYSAPEHTSSGIYTTKSDIYSFGVVMLELLTGRKALDSTRPRSEQSLVRWAVPQLHDIDALAKMLDPTIEGAYSKKSVSRFADVICQCVQTEPEFRPSMSEVIQNLEHLQEM